MDRIKKRDMHDIMGMFHWINTLMNYARRHVQWSGFQDVLIEAEVFVQLTLSSVFEGSQYVCSFQRILMVSYMFS